MIFLGAGLLPLLVLVFILCSFARVLGISYALSTKNNICRLKKNSEKLSGVSTLLGGLEFISVLLELLFSYVHTLVFKFFLSDLYIVV